jgi:hypothetical protein
MTNINEIKVIETCTLFASTPYSSLCGTCTVCPNNGHVNAEVDGYSMCIMPTTIKTVVLINEQHTLMDAQSTLIEESFGEFVFVKVPASGWNKDEQHKVMNALSKMGEEETINVVFVSPIPSMIKALSFEEGYQSMSNDDRPGHVCCSVSVMANDSRDKKELPNGKVVYVVAKEGWYLA